MPRLASITTQSFTGIAVSGGVKLVEDFIEAETVSLSGVTQITGIHAGQNGSWIHACTDGDIRQFATVSPYVITGMTLDVTFDPTTNANGAATTGGVNWDASGRNYYFCCASQIEQYSVPTGQEYDIDNRLSIESNKLSVTNPGCIQMAPDDVTVLIAFGSSIDQYDIDPFFVRSIANATATGDSLSVANCVACAYYDSGESLLVLQTNGVVTQYTLNTAYSIADGTSVASTLNTGLTGATGITVANNYMYVSQGTSIRRYA